MCFLFREGCHQKSPSRGYIPLVWGKLVHPLKGYLVFYSTPRRAPYGYIPHIIGDVFWPPPPLPIVGSLLILESKHHQTTQRWEDFTKSCLIKSLSASSVCSLIKTKVCPVGGGGDCSRGRAFSSNITRYKQNSGNPIIVRSRDLDYCEWNKLPYHLKSSCGFDSDRISLGSY